MNIIHPKINKILSDFVESLNIYIVETESKITFQDILDGCKSNSQRRVRRCLVNILSRDIKLNNLEISFLLKKTMPTVEYDKTRYNCLASQDDLRQEMVDKSMNKYLPKLIQKFNELY